MTVSPLFEVFGPGGVAVFLVFLSAEDWWLIPRYPDTQMAPDTQTTIGLPHTKLGVPPQQKNSVSVCQCAWYMIYTKNIPNTRLSRFHTFMESFWTGNSAPPITGFGVIWVMSREVSPVSTISDMNHIKKNCAKLLNFKWNCWGILGTWKGTFAGFHYMEHRH